MFPTNIFKQNICCGDPNVRFKKSSVMYVRGDLLITNYDNDLFYITFKDYIALELKDWGTVEGGYFMFRLVGKKPKELDEFKDDSIYMIFDYSGAKNRMPTGIIEIKSKLED